PPQSPLLRKPAGRCGQPICRVYRWFERQLRRNKPSDREQFDTEHGEPPANRSVRRQDRLLATLRFSHQWGAKKGSPFFIMGRNPDEKPGKPGDRTGRTPVSPKITDGAEVL